MNRKKKTPKTITNPTTNPIISPTTSPNTNPTTNPNTNPTTTEITNPIISPNTNPTTNPNTSPTTSPNTNPTTNPNTNPTTNPITNPTCNQMMNQFQTYVMKTLPIYQPYTNQMVREGDYVRFPLANNGQLFTQDQVEFGNEKVDCTILDGYMYMIIPRCMSVVSRVKYQTHTWDVTYATPSSIHIILRIQDGTFTIQISGQDLGDVDHPYSVLWNGENIEYTVLEYTPTGISIHLDPSVTIKQENYITLCRSGFCTQRIDIVYHSPIVVADE